MQINKRLNHDGVVYMNLISTDDQSYTFPRGIDNTVRSVFASCSTHRIDTDGVALFKKLYRCERSRLDNNGATYTDKNTKAAYDVSI